MTNTASRSKTSSELLDAEIRLFEQGEKLIQARDQIETLESDQRQLLADNQALTDRIAALEKALAEQETDQSYKLRVLELERQLLLSENARRKAETDLPKLKSKLSESEAERKKLSSLNPERMKKNLNAQKAKVAELREQLDAVKRKAGESADAAMTWEAKYKEAGQAVDLVLAENDAYQLFDSERWGLRLTHFQFTEEAEAQEKREFRIRCLDYRTGTSALATGLDDTGDCALWSADIGIPEEVSRVAAEDLRELKATGTLKRLHPSKGKRKA